MNKYRASRPAALRCLIVLLAFMALAVGFPGSAIAQSVVVMVNGDPITSYDIDQRAKFTHLVSRKTPARQEVIDELIN